MKKVPISKNNVEQWSFQRDKVESLSAGEDVLIVMDRVGSDSLTVVDHLFGGFSTKSADKPSPQITFGDYDVSLILMKKPVRGKEIIILPQERCYGEDTVVSDVTGEGGEVVG